MFDMTRVSRCIFYLLFYTLTTLVENSESQDRVRPAQAACENYRKTLGELMYQPIPGYADINKEASRGEFPYLVAVGFLHSEPGNDGAPKYNRAGVLISEKHVLTTAFAVSTFDGKIPVEVLLGSTDPRDTEQSATGIQRRRISRIIWHPNYDRRFEYNNLAILELKSPVEFTVFVQPLCLMTEPMSPQTEGANNLAISTRSSDYFDSLTKPSTIRRIFGLKFVAKNECSSFYRSNLPRIPNGLGDDMICLGKNPSSEAPCYGRTSTPVIRNANGFIFLAGITTFHYACPSEKPSVAVSVFQHLEWIEREVWPH